jgi:hypothetical protein
MDPFLEEHWGDVHQRLIMYGCDQLAAQLPAALRARVQERVFVESEEGWSRSVYPDLRIVHRAGAAPAAEPTVPGGGVALAPPEMQADDEPLVVRLPAESLTEGFIEIVDRAAGNQVVTVIEVLSPANKAGGNGTAEYLRKQREVLVGGTSLVEIDLLRGGRRVTAVRPESLHPARRGPYYVCLHRGWRPDEFEVYTISLRRRLPTIRIPLRQTDPDARLDLQALLEQAYRLGRYDDLDYTRPLEPPLDGADAAWAAELLRGRAQS